jgi:hypothetical protein
MRRARSFATLALALPLGLAGCGMIGSSQSVPVPSTPAATSGANPMTGAFQNGAGTQTGPSAGPEGGATQAGIGAGNTVGSAP